jgi:hypothetical protein
VRPRVYPEARGNGTAKTIELDRVKREIDRQRASKQQDSKEIPMQTQQTPCKRGPYNRGKILDPRIRDVLQVERDRVGFEGLVLRLERVIDELGGDHKGHDCTRASELAFNDPQHRFIAYWNGYLGQLAGNIRGLGYSDKSKLKALANDPLHRENLNKFGVALVRTVIPG